MHRDGYIIDEVDRQRCDGKQPCTPCVATDRGSECSNQEPSQETYPPPPLIPCGYPIPSSNAISLSPHHSKELNQQGAQLLQVGASRGSNELGPDLASTAATIIHEHSTPGPTPLSASVLHVLPSINFGVGPFRRLYIPPSSAPPEYLKVSRAATPEMDMVLCVLSLFTYAVTFFQHYLTVA